MQTNTDKIINCPECEAPLTPQEIKDHQCFDCGHTWQDHTTGDAGTGHD